MTAQTETPQIQTSSTATLTLNVNREHTAIHLAILGDRTNYIVTAKNHNTNKVRNKALTKVEILTFAEDMNNQGFCVWISLNPKEDDGNIYVTALADFWLDIDARPKGIDDRAATQQEIDEAYDRAIKLKEYIEKTYGAVGFIAFSGNGYHLHFPLPHTEFTPEQRALIGTSETDTVTNAKVRNFAKQTASNIGKTIDNTYDINRKTALIGSFNLKILNQPIQTCWLDLPKDTFGAVQYARRQNQRLLDAILATSTEQQQQTTKRDITKPHLKLEEILEQDQKLNDLYNGNWKNYGYPTRSEAEAAVLTILFGRYGFSTDEAREAMKNCKIGKWQERPDGYRETTLQNALKWITEHPTEDSQLGNGEEKEDHREERKSQAQKAIELCLSEGVELFHDQHRQPYARIKNMDNVKTAYDGGDDKDDELNTKRVITYYSITSLTSRDFKNYVANLMYEHYGKTINNEALNEALNVLYYKATRGPEAELYNRVAPDPSGDGSIWIDIADKHNHAYHVTVDDWKLCSSLQVPCVFKREEHQKALALAVQNGNPWKILRYNTNVTGLTLLVLKSPSLSSLSSLTEEQRKKALLFMIQEASYGIPNMPHPLQYVFGPHGTWKSTEQILAASVWDASSVPAIGLDGNNNKDFFQFLEKHYIPIIDNISYIPNRLSDMLCRVVTGAGQEIRALYTNNDSFIRRFRRCPMLNGLNLATEEGDLLDRTIPYETTQNSSWRTEAELKTEYENDLPEILGGFLDLISKALKLKATVKPEKLFRLADFSEWACVLAEALGIKQSEFIDAYESVVERQNQETLTKPIATAFVKFCESVKLNDKGIYENTPAIVFSEVENQALNLGINIKSKKWPKEANFFTRELNRCRAAIAYAGWDYEVVPGKQRIFRIWKNPEVKKIEKRLCKAECEHWGHIDLCPLGTGGFKPDIEIPPKERPCSGYLQKGSGEA